MSQLAQKISLISIQSNISILQALKRMDKTGRKLLLVFEDKYFRGLLSIGDIQRAIIKKTPLNSSIEKITRQNIRLAYEHEPFEDIKHRMFVYRTECMPVLDNQGNLKDVYFWEDVFPPEEKRIKRELNLPVVIMAGGKGSRLKPLTNIIPKALIPIDEKTIIYELSFHSI